MALIGRFFMICFAVMLASLAAGMVFAIGLLGPDWRGFSGDFIERGTFWSLTFVASGMTWAVGLLPMATGIILAEMLRLRSLLIYAAAGAAMFTLAAWSMGAVNSYEESIDYPPPAVPRGAEISAAAGIAFGLVYWLIAGRNAGRWREPRT